MIVPISINSLKEGWTIAETITSKDGKSILVKSGLTLSNSIIDKLKRELLTDEKPEYFIDILTNDIDKTEQDLEIEKIADEQKKYREKINKLDHDIEETLDINIKNNSIQNFKKAYNSNENNLENNIKDLKLDMSNLVSNIITKPEFTYSLGQYKDNQNDIAHLVRVAEFAIVLANHYNKTVPYIKQINLEAIATAAMLHDFGTKYNNPKEMAELSKQKISSSLTTKYGISQNILKDGYNEKNHTLYTYVALSKKIEPIIAQMIFLSGAKEDSIFYKKQADPEASFVIGAKIIRICDFYDNLLNTVIKRDIQLESVSALMIRQALNGEYDRKLIELFLEKIPLYSKGIRVELTNGAYGIIDKGFTAERKINGGLKCDEIAHPTVVVIGQEKDSKNIIPYYDLRNHNNITIKRIIGNNEILSKKIKPYDQDEFLQTSLNIQKQNMNIFHDEKSEKIR